MTLRVRLRMELVRRTWLWTRCLRSVMPSFTGRVWERCAKFPTAGAAPRGAPATIWELFQGFATRGILLVAGESGRQTKHG